MQNVQETGTAKRKNQIINQEPSARGLFFGFPGEQGSNVPALLISCMNC